MRKVAVVFVVVFLVVCPLLAIPFGAFMAVSLSSGGSSTAGAQPSGAASAESLTVDDATVNAVAAVTGLPPMAVRGLAIVAAMSKDKVGCDVPWWLLGGIGNAESGNGTHGVSSIGNDWIVSPTIGGPPLDGNGYALILDGAGSIAFAEGPFQFIPSSWVLFGEDANGDGVDDINSYLDAALAAANHLCHSAGGPGSDMRDPTTARRGILGYNHSDSYADLVWSTGVRYRDQAGDVLTTNRTGAPSASAGATEAYGVTVAASTWDGPSITGDSLEGLDPNFRARLSRLAAMTQEATGGVAYVFSGYRPVEEQRQIIANHGGECGVWVACVDESTGTCGSFHCKGLAVDMAWTSDAADAYWHDHAAEAGIRAPMSWEPWHMEPIETRGGGYAS